jgi:flavin-dependent dehydrogenase
MITSILAEMEVWDKVEAANFPIKLGGTYRWGATDELWSLNFVPPEEYRPTSRPAPLDSQRSELSFQVDRSKYDKILLDHARECGCDVFEGVSVRSVTHTSDYVTGLELEGPDIEVGSTLKARYYVDATGENAVLRRSLGIETEIPTTLRNIAFWDYWEGADWAETAGTTATRIQVMSLGWGWLWFIPISQDRTSIGLVLPSGYYKASGKKPEQLYHEAVRADPLISQLTRNAKCEGRFTATKDWNFLTSRLAGTNWFLAGDSCGFADPILSAGMTLAHTSGRKVACSILELFRKQQDPAWIRQQYSDGHRAQISHHMRFAEFWYAGNGRFTDLKAYCSEIAESAGLKLDPDEAFRWLGTGGFALDNPGFAQAASFPLAGVKQMTKFILGEQARWSSLEFNSFRSNLNGVKQKSTAFYDSGRIVAIPTYERGGKSLPLCGLFPVILQLLEHTSDGLEVMRLALNNALRMEILQHPSQSMAIGAALEALVSDGWVIGTLDPNKPNLRQLATTGRP